jgi:predicted nucleotidyltransferase component of viral defense system
MKKQVLNNFQKQILKALGQSELCKLYTWGGGTALAYYFKHRLSEDLDFFSLNLYHDEVILTAINKIKKNLKISRIKALKKQNRYLFTLTKNKQNLKLEFIYFPFPALAKSRKVSEFNIKIDSILDLAANKLFALYERVEPKDVFDLYFLFNHKKYSLNFLIKKIDKKFGVEIDKITLHSQAKKALSKIDSLKPQLAQKINFKNMGKYIDKVFQQNTKTYLKNLLMF